MSATPPAGYQRREPTPQEFVEMQNDPQFLELKKTFRSFVLPTSIGFFLWFILYLLLATFAVDFMSIRLFGNINVAMFMGFLQFVSTFAITWVYVNFANKKLEPMSTAVRERMEGNA